MIDIHTYPRCSEMNSYMPKYLLYSVKQWKYALSLSSCGIGQSSREVAKYWGHHMMTSGVLVQSGKENEVSQFALVLHFSFKGIPAVT